MEDKTKSGIAKDTEQEQNKAKNQSAKGQRRSGHDRKRNRNTNNNNNESKDQKRYRGNDYHWYVINDAIGQAVASIPYNQFPGVRINVGRAIAKNSIIAQPAKQTIPGIMGICYVPGPGRSKGATSAVNIAAKSIYSWVRHANSGHSNYESSDLMLYILAMDDVYSSYGEAVRMYKTAMTFVAENRNIPDLLLTSMGVKPDTLRENLAQFRYRINLLAAKISSMAVPDVCDIFKRHVFLTNAVYSDSTSNRSQFYVFKKTGYYTFDATTSSGGSLRYTEYAGPDEALFTRTWQQVIADLESQIDPIISDEDMNIMSGDILKAYGSDKIYHLAMVDENATVDILSDENILGQIENAFIGVNSDGGDYAPSITQENNLIMYSGPTCKILDMNASAVAAYSVASGSRIFNSHKDNPDWKDALEWTRFVPGGMVDDEDDGTYSYSSFGTEVVRNFEFAYYYVSPEDESLVINGTTCFTSMLSNSNSVDKRIASLMSMFDWHPIMYTHTETTVGGTTTVSDFFPFGDLKKYTLISPDIIDGINDAAVMGELAFNLKA
nr:hypothetical protein [Picobirnavirus sp.]AVD97006.1 capsid protein [Picobirnavirus sp.]